MQFSDEEQPLVVGAATTEDGRAPSNRLLDGTEWEPREFLDCHEGFRRDFAGVNLDAVDGLSNLHADSS